MTQPATVPTMVDMDGPPPSRVLQVALAAGLLLLAATAAYGLITLALDDEPGIDSDGDGMPDSWELKHSGEPKVEAADGRSKRLVGLDFSSVDANSDLDHDGLTNLQEFCWPLTVETCTIEKALEDDRGGVSEEARLNPQDSDSDGDGIPDGAEVVLCTRQMAMGIRSDDGLCLDFSPLIKSDNDVDEDGVDLDGDGTLDGVEQLNSSEEHWFGAPDSWMVEFDGLWDGGLDPLSPDSDLDGIPDGVEIGWDMDPLNFTDGVLDLDLDGFNGPLTAQQEHQVNADSRLGGVFRIPLSTISGSLRAMDTISEIESEDLMVHPSGAVHPDAVAMHVGSQSGWLAMEDEQGLWISPLDEYGNMSGDSQLLVSVQVDDVAMLKMQSGTTRLAYLTSADRIGVLELTEGGSLISEWNASDAITGIGSDLLEIESSGDGIWISVDSGLVYIDSLDLLDMNPSIVWRQGPFNNPDEVIPFTSLIGDPVEEGGILAARGESLARWFPSEEVLDSENILPDAIGIVSALENDGQGIWYLGSDEGIWSLDMNQHVDDWLESTPMVRGKVQSLALSDDAIIASFHGGNYSGLHPLDPRSNDSDGDGWMDGFELAMGTDPTRANDTFLCNGYAILCTRDYDDVAYPATHNSHANPHSGFNNLAENQLASITGQLEMGIRYINLDVYDYNDEVWVCHGDWDLIIHPCLQSGGERALNQLNEISDFMQDNPDVVITLAFQNYVDANTMHSEFNSSGLSQYLFSKDDQWPTLGEMVNSGNRLVVMADSQHQNNSWWHDEHGETRMTGFSYTSDDEFDCNNNRGNDTATMIQVAHYITDPLSSEADAQLVNQFASMWRHAQKCIDQHGMIPNFMLVDYADYGDAVLVAAVLNGVEDPPPGALS